MNGRWKRRLAYGALGLVGLVAVARWYVPFDFDLFPETPPDERPVLLDVAEAFPRGTRVTLVTAHPDDAEFYLGATLPQLRDAGAELSLIVVTDGDKGYYPFEDAERNRVVRDLEQRESAAAWGAKSVTFLHFPDGRVRSGTELNDALRAAIEPLRPEVILAFDDRYPPFRQHRDHLRSGEAVTAILPTLAGVRAVARFSTVAPNRIVDATKDWNEKLALMKLHKSQFDSPRTGLANRLLGRAGDDPFPWIANFVRAFAKEDGAKVGVELGEGLRWAVT